MADEVQEPKELEAPETEISDDDDTLSTVVEVVGDVVIGVVGAVINIAGDS